MKKVKVLRLTVAIVLVVISILVIIIISNNKLSHKILGAWTTDGVTVYKFEKYKSGVLALPHAEYKFKYKVKDNILSIDFKDERVTDSSYEISIDGDNLILKNTNKTMDPFIFIRYNGE